MAGTIDATSGVSGALTMAWSLAGSIDAQAGVSATLSQSVDIGTPAAGATLQPPNTSIFFDFEATGATPYVEDFEYASWPADWLKCTPANEFTASGWNGGSDTWHLYQDGAEKVLRTQAKGTAIFAEPWHPFLHNGHCDTVVQLRWYTDAEAGLVHRARAFDDYGKQTEGLRAVAAEIDSGGFRLVFYNNGTRQVRQTAAFTPSSGTWYWIRLQSSGPWGMKYRGKYWTGARDAEPASWNLEEDDGLNKGNTRWKGQGVHNHGTGDAYFDHYELAGQLDPVDTALLTVEVNGKAHTVAAGEITVEPWAIYEQWFTGDGHNNLAPDLHNWRCIVRPRQEEAYDPDGGQAVTVKWDGDTVLTWSFDTSSFPDRAPPATGAGDPLACGSFQLSGDDNVPWGVRGMFLPLGFSLSFGYQKLSYAVAGITPHGQGWDLRYIVYADLYAPVDGRYLVAHPVDVVIPAGFIPGEPKEVVIPGGIVPKGDAGDAFPAGLIPQGWIRHDTPGGVIPSVRFFYRGKASGVVGVRFFDRFKGSGVVYQVNRDNEIEIHVINEETYQALVAAGVDFE
jgi:hypothetical protein